MEHPTPTKKAQEPYVFVCYAHADKDIVYRELRWLTDNGIDFWYDQGISAGTVWRAEIGEALEGAKAVLFYVSRHALASDHCNREANYGLDQGKPFIPVRLDEAELTPDLRVGLSRVQALVRHELTEDDYRTRLLDSLRDATGASVATVPAAPNKAPPTAGKRSGAAWRTIAALAIIAAFGGAAFWSNFFDGVPEAAIDRSVSIASPTVTGQNAEAEALAQTIVGGIIRHISTNRIFDVDTSSDSQASYLLTTSVHSAGDSVTIDVQLTRQGTNQSVWSHSVSADFGEDPDILARIIGRRAQGAMSIDLSCEKYGRKAQVPAAAAYYCEGRWEESKFNHGGEADWQIIRNNAQKAVELDPTFAAAHGMLSSYYTNQADTNIRPGGRDTHTREDATHLARAHARKALQLDPDDPKSHAARANVALQLDLDYEAAESGYQTAIRLDPNSDWVAGFYMAIARTHLYRGNLNAAVDNFERALNVDNAWGQLYQAYAVILAMAGDWDRAIRMCDMGLELIPRGFDNAVFRLYKARAHLALGEQDEAVRQIDRAWEEVGRYAPYLMPLSLARIGRREQAEEIVAGMVSDGTINAGLMVYGMLGIQNLDGAFEWLHKAIDDRDQNMVQYIRIEPNLLFEPMRQDSRWADILEHLARVEAESRLAGRAY